MESLLSAVKRHAESIPDKTACAFRGEKLSYGALYDTVVNAAGVLSDKGAKAGDYIMISAVSKPDYIVAMLAVQYIGAVSVPVDKSSLSATLRYIREEINAKFFLCNAVPKSGFDGCETIKLTDLRAMASAYDKTPPKQSTTADENTLCELLFTTGTTGKPKGAMHTYKGITANICNTWHGIGMVPDDIILNPLPLNHSFGMRVCRTALYIGATQYFQNGFTFAKEVEDALQNLGCTGFVTVPATLEKLLLQLGERCGEVMGKLRYIEIGAGSVSAGTKKKLLSALPDVEFFNTWGSTETGGAIFLNFSKHPDKITSLGKPIDSAEVRIIDADGRTVEENGEAHVGRMILKGDMQTVGYINRPELTADTLRDGWLYTNDLVYRDSDGFIYMLGRADDIIKVGGENVSPLEIENVASQYEQINECACIGIDDPDGIMGQIPILYYVTGDIEFDKKALEEFLLKNLERYKLPKQYIAIDAIPRNNMKKIDRAALSTYHSQTENFQLYNPVIQALLERRSIRKFKNMPIPRPILEMIVKTGTYAPSGHNMQTWKFTVLTDTAEIARLRELVKVKAKENNVHFYGFENPAALIFVSNDNRNVNGIQDSSCAAENIMLAAHSYGLGSVWLNPLRTMSDVPEIRERLNAYNIPANHNVWTMIALGYPDESGKLLAKKADTIRFL